MADVDLTGANGNITYSGAELTSITARTTVVRGAIRRREFRTTRQLYVQHRYAYGPWEGSLIVRIAVTDDGHPALPSCPTQATLVVKQRSGAQNLTLLGTMNAMGNLGFNALSGEPQALDYSFVLDGRTTSDTPAVS